MKPLIYVSGKISDKTPQLELRNCAKAVRTARKLWQAGFYPVVPHTLSGVFDSATADRLGVHYEDFMRLDLRVLSICDCMLMLPNWMSSEGAKRERARFLQRKRPVFYSLGEAKAWLRERGRA